MPSTGRRDLLANRWEPFVHVIRFEGQDLTGATFIAQVRATRDAGGTAPVDLLTVGGIGSEGITIVSVANEDVDFGVDIGVVNVPVTTISMRINEATMEAFDEPPIDRLGDDLPYWWDMQITPSGGVKYRALEGQFTIHAGVTH